MEGAIMNRYSNEIKVVLARLLANFRGTGFRPKYSYAQCGEDIIVDFIFMWLRRTRITYLDIGANDPIEMNNTYFFYKRKHRGVLVEPDPRLCRKIKRARPGDVCIHAGVGMGAGDHVSFFLMEPDTLSTSSPEKVAEYLQLGVKLKKEMKVPLIGIHDIIEKYFHSLSPDYLSVDVEGRDFEIIKSLDLMKYRPVVICAETLTYTNNNTEQKIEEISDYLNSYRYFVYADTYINTIYVDRDVWDARPKN